MFDVGEQSNRFHFDLMVDGDELNGIAEETGKQNSGLKVTAVRRFD